VKWYVLRQRRHEGPFSHSELEAGLKGGQWTRADFLLSDDNFEKGNLNYQRLSDVLEIPLEPSAKKDSKPAPAGVSTAELLKAVGNLEAVEIVDAQARVRQDQGKRDETRTDPGQLVSVQGSRPRGSFFRLQTIPTFGIVLFMTIAIVGLSGYLQTHSKPGVDSLEITAGEAAKAKPKNAHVERRPAAPRRPESSSPIMPSHPRDFEDNRGHEDAASPEENSDGEAETERVENNRPSELQKLKRRKEHRTDEVNEGGPLDSMDVDLRQRDRRPGAFDEHEDNDRGEDHEDNGGRNEGNDNDDTENPEAIE
jgi:hypothetical protein